MAEYLVHPTCQIPGLSEIYESVFGKGFVGSFVEVGAFDGVTYSNTWGLAKEGWEGIYIEAHPDFAKQCANNHAHNQKIKVIRSACGATVGKIDLTIFGECSTAVLSKWNRDWGMNENTPKVRVNMNPLDHILYYSYDIDLLVIDVEEMEIEVLKGFTLENYMPKMVIIELHEGQGTQPDQKGWQTPWVDSYFRQYKKIYSDAINTIYLHESEYGN